MADSAALQAIAETNSKFSRDFYKALSGHTGNLVASPLSAQLVLALAQLGARGETASEMATALCLPADAETSKNGFLALINTLKSTDKVILEIANKMYVKENFELAQEFVTAAKETFNSTADKVNFLDPGTPKLINSWVEKSTHDKIKDLIPDDLFDGLTRLVLINAVYFKGPWLSPFDPSRTRPRDFYTDEETKVQTLFMYQKTHYGYAQLEHLDCQLLEMPYVGRQLSLVILLPNKRTGLAELEKKMETEDLSELMKKASNRELELYLPKFKMEVTLNLNEPLKKMGMGRMYSNTADFSGISSSEPLQVSDVLQKTFIEVSEEGTEAASATAMVCNYCMPPMVDMEHPFMLYLVQHMPNGRIITLFVGCYIAPSLV